MLSSNKLANNSSVINEFNGFNAADNDLPPLFSSTGPLDTPIPQETVTLPNVAASQPQQPQEENNHNNQSLDNTLDPLDDLNNQLDDEHFMMTLEGDLTSFLEANNDFMALGNYPIPTPTVTLQDLYEQMQRGDVPTALAYINMLSLEQLQAFAACNPVNMTLIHYATTLGSAELVQALILKGLSASDKDKNGSTPLHYAALAQQHDIAAILLGQQTWMTRKSEYDQCTHGLKDAHDKLNQSTAQKAEIEAHRATLATTLIQLQDQYTLAVQSSIEWENKSRLNNTPEIQDQKIRANVDTDRLGRGLLQVQTQYVETIARSLQSETQKRVHGAAVEYYYGKISEMVTQPVQQSLHLNSHQAQLFHNPGIQNNAHNANNNQSNSNNRADWKF